MSDNTALTEQLQAEIDALLSQREVLRAQVAAIEQEVANRKTVRDSLGVLQQDADLKLRVKTVLDGA
ncbi:MAG: hypothetical protein WC829_16870 [Hyphomicrobium sp.]|jgi:phage shock protein A